MLNLILFTKEVRTKKWLYYYMEMKMDNVKYRDPRINRYVKLTGSIRKTRVAAVKFKPTPPAFNDSNITVGESADLSENDVIASVRRRIVIDPSSRTNLKPDSFKGFSRRLRN